MKTNVMQKIHFFQYQDRYTANENKYALCTMKAQRNYFTFTIQISQGDGKKS